MPLYEYKCKECGHRFEKIQSFSAEPITDCPVCEGEVERLISAPAVHFKGSGFYSTDYGAKPAKKSSDSATDGSSKAQASEGSAAAPSASKAESSATAAAAKSGE